MQACAARFRACCPARNRSTACTVPSWSNRRNSSRTTAWTCSSGSRATSPEGRRTYPAGSLSVFIQFFAFFGYTFVSLQYLQGVRGDSPLIAALSLLLAVMMPAARLTPKLTARLRPRTVCAAGLVLVAAGLAVISQVGTTTSYWLFLAGLIPLGVGMGAAMTPATTAITEALPAAQQGVGSALNDLSREVGGALGIAVIGSIVTAVYRSSLYLPGIPGPGQPGPRLVRGDPSRQRPGRGRRQHRLRRRHPRRTAVCRRRRRARRDHRHGVIAQRPAPAQPCQWRPARTGASHLEGHAHLIYAGSDILIVPTEFLDSYLFRAHPGYSKTASSHPAGQAAVSRRPAPSQGSSRPGVSLRADSTQTLPSSATNT
jgi:hypothetical protein